MTMQEYMIRNGLENIYGANAKNETWVSSPCPDCKGGFSGSVQRIKNAADIPTAFYDKRLDAFSWDYFDDKNRKIDTIYPKKIVTSFIDQFGKWEQENLGLYIFSNTKGSGKTLLASCICNELMATQAIKTRFVNANDLITISQSGDKESYDKYKRDPMLLLKDCKLLVIDDLGQKNGAGGWMEDLLYPILDDRMNNRRMTIITSNYAIDNLPFDDRITDRINKLCFPLKLPEIKMRAKEAQAARNNLMKEMGII